MDTSIRNEGQLFLDSAWGEFVTGLQRCAERTGKEIPNLEPYRPLFHNMFRVILAELEQYQRDCMAATRNGAELFAARLKEINDEVCQREVADHKAWAVQSTA